MSDKNDSEEEKEEKAAALKVKSYTDIQRMKLEKLMKDPMKPVHIPERPKEKNVNKAPEFNHNIMGSSAGAGSGEFHLYRQMRRKEQNRLKVLSVRKDRDDLNEAYHQKLEENEKLAEERTAKKRKKRQKKKANMKNKDKKKTEQKEIEPSSSEDDEDEQTPENKEAPKQSSENNVTEKASDNVAKVAKSPTEKEKKGLVLVYYSNNE